MGFDRTALETWLATPGHPFFETAGQWRLALKALEEEPLAGKRVVDFCCGGGEIGLWMANEGAEVYLLDFSREVVDEALQRARSFGLDKRVRGIVVQGSKLDMFADKGFDLVLTRELPDSQLLAELARAMKPDARLVAVAPDGQTAQLSAAGFGVERVVRAHQGGGWLESLLGKKKRGEAVVTARRAQ